MTDIHAALVAAAETLASLLSDEGGIAFPKREDCLKARTLITELLSYRSEGVAVKPLEWSSYGGMRWRAKSPLGRFTVNPDSDRRFYVSVNGDPVPGRHATSDAAMAAAQLDYATRIKSALISSTERAETIEGWQPIETAPKDGTRILLAKIVGHPDHETALWWATVGAWSSKWNNWNDGIEPAGLVPPTHWMHVTAKGVGRALNPRDGGGQ